MFRVQRRTLELALERSGRRYREAYGDDRPQWLIDNFDWDAALDLADESAISDSLRAFRAEIALAMASGGMQTLQELGSPLGLVFDLANPRAVQFLEKHGGELITNINNTTRKACHSLIEEGMREGWSYDVLAKALTARYEDFAVGKPQLHIRSRAHLIAVTEMANGYHEGSYQQGIHLQELGLNLEKVWITSGDDRVSEGCQENESVGYIPFGSEFPSGHLHPPRFPGCRCFYGTQRLVGEEAPAAVPPALMDGPQLRAYLKDERAAFAGERARLGAEEKAAKTDYRRAIEQNLSKKIREKHYQTYLERMQATFDHKGTWKKTVHEALRVANPQAFALKGMKKLGVKGERAQAFVQGILGIDGFDKKTLYFRMDAGRASYDGHGTIKLESADAVSVWVHEIGHWIEEINPKYSKNVRSFWRARKGTEVLQKLSVLEPGWVYGADEMSFKDKWLISYMGKKYPLSTEITSMGLEMLYSDPWKLISRDPEYFDMIMQGLRFVPLP